VRGSSPRRTRPNVFIVETNVVRTNRARGVPGGHHTRDVCLRGSASRTGSCAYEVCDLVAVRGLSRRRDDSAQGTMGELAAGHARSTGARSPTAVGGTMTERLIGRVPRAEREPKARRSRRWRIACERAVIRVE
jgi:hypothetical protein